MELHQSPPLAEMPKIVIDKVPTGPVIINSQTHAISGEVVSFGEGFLLSSGNMKTFAPVEFDGSTPKNTQFHLFSQTSGNSTFHSNDFAPIKFTGDNVTLFRPRENPGGYSSIAAGEEVHCFEIHFSADRLIEWFGDEVPKEIWPLLSYSIDVGLGLPLPVLNAQYQLRNLLGTRPFLGNLAKVALEGAALHMCAAYLSYLGDEKMRDWPAIEAREERIAYNAREILLADLRIPPNVSDLARMVGLSPRRLSLVFKDVFAMSIFQALTQARLDFARTRLLAGGATVKEVAYETGYSHVSNFSTAFKSRFGVSPSQIAGNDAPNEPGKFE